MREIKFRMGIKHLGPGQTTSIKGVDGNWAIRFENVEYNSITTYDTAIFLPKGVYDMSKGCFHSKTLCLRGDINIDHNKEINIGQ